LFISFLFENLLFILFLDDLSDGFQNFVSIFGEDTIGYGKTIDVILHLG